VLAVDTNVLVYLLLEGDRTADAQALYEKDADWRSEGFLLVEFSNVLATYRRRGVLAGDTAAELLDTVMREAAYACEIRGPRRRQARENLKKLRGMIRRAENRGGQRDRVRDPDR